ncbi:MAG: hypothetical protein P8Y68_18915 [Anaerolineales bacterium]
MDFYSARKQYQRLSRLFHNGEITEEEFVQGVDDLAITDQEGTEWQIGLQSGRWYRRKGAEWVEDQPFQDGHQPKPNRGRRALFAFLVLLLLLLALLGANYFSNSGDEEPDPKGEGLAISEGTATLTPDDAGEEPSDSELTPTPSPVSEEPTPTITATLLPPPPRVPPQVWEVESQSWFTASDPLKGEWLAVSEQDWEYENITYGNTEGLFLQYAETVRLWHAVLATFVDSDRSLTLAMTNTTGIVSLACRYHPGTGVGYRFELSWDRWALMFYWPGESFVLAEGQPSEAFRQGEFNTFRVRCAGETISVWDSRGLLASVEDDRNPDGALGLFFDVSQGVGGVVIAADRVSVLKEAGSAGAGDTFWLDAIEVTLADRYSSGTSAEPILAALLRRANWGDTEVTITRENIYLTNGDIRVYPLELGSIGEEDGLLPLPQTPTAEYSIGEVYFSGIGPEELNDWQLVLDLRYEGYGEAVFPLGE